MPQATRAARIKKLKEQQAALAAKRQRLLAQESEAARKRAAHRQFLAGRMVLDKVSRGEWDLAEVMSWLDRFLKKPRDRRAFDLLPNPAEHLRELRAAGHSERAIAKTLAAEGVQPGRYKKWNRDTVRRILAAADEEAGHGSTE